MIKSEKFIGQKNILAIIGVSANPNKWGFKIYEELKSNGFKVYPINPKYNKINKDICYPDLASLPKKPNVVITVVPPKITENIVKQCKSLGINKVWMQPGSESKEAITFCENNKIKVIANVCFVIGNLSKKF